MDDHEYRYQLRPLVIPGLSFLIIYPLVLGGIHLFKKFPIPEAWALTAIYLLALIVIVVLWVVGKSKRVSIRDQEIVLRSLLGERVLDAQDIRRVSFYFDRKGQEVAQIRAGELSYYLTEFYFPFPELMTDLEFFIKQHGLRSNLQDATGGNI